MVREVYGVHLSVQEKGRLKKMIRTGRSSAQAITRARILLRTDEGWTASRVAAAFDVSERTVRRASAGTWKGDWRRCCGTTTHPPPTARWTRRWKPT